MNDQNQHNKPSFPIFKNLVIQDKDNLEPFINNFPPYSDFNFVSLLCYDTYDDVHFSWLNNNLVIKFKDYIKNTHFYSFLGNKEIKKTIFQLFNYIDQLDLQTRLELIPELNIKELLSSPINSISIVEDINQNDYIIPLKESAKLLNINEHKKQSYENFVSNNPRYKVIELNLNEPDTQKKLLDLFQSWQTYRNKTDEEVNTEKTALKKLFAINKEFDFYSLGIYIDQDLIGFIIDERIKKPYVIGHFIKADLHYKGIYEVLNKISAEAHYKDGYEFINIEQDLGIPGLRTSKLQRSPVYFLKKYIVQPANL